MKISKTFRVSALSAILVGSCFNQIAFSKDKTLRILVLGQSNSGKSTFINNFYNVLGGNLNQCGSVADGMDQFYRLIDQTQAESEAMHQIPKEKHHFFSTSPIHPNYISNGITSRTAIAEHMINKGLSSDPLKYQDIIEFSSSDFASKYRRNYQYILPANSGDKKQIDKLVPFAEGVVVNKYEGIDDGLEINQNSNSSQVRSIQGYTFEAKATALASATDTNRHFVELIDTPGLTDINSADDPAYEDKILDLIDSFLDSPDGDVHAVIFVASDTTSGQRPQDIRERYERYVNRLAYIPRHDDNLPGYRSKFGSRLFFMLSLKEGNPWNSPIVSFKAPVHAVARQNDIAAASKIINSNYLIENNENADLIFSQYLRTNLMGYKVPFSPEFFTDEEVNNPGLTLSKESLLSMLGEFEMMALKLSRLNGLGSSEELWPYPENYEGFRTDSSNLSNAVGTQLEIKKNIKLLLSKLEENKDEMHRQKQGLEIAEQKSKKTQLFDGLVFENDASESVEIVTDGEGGPEWIGQIHVLDSHLDRNSYPLTTEGENNGFKISIESILLEGDHYRESDDSGVLLSPGRPLERLLVKLGDQSSFSETFIVNLIPSPTDEKDQQALNLVLGASDKIASEFSDLREYQRESIRVRVPCEPKPFQKHIQAEVVNLEWQQIFSERQTSYSHLEQEKEDLKQFKEKQLREYRKLHQDGTEAGKDLLNSAQNSGFGSLEKISNRLTSQSIPREVGPESTVFKRAKRRVLGFLSIQDSNPYESEGEEELLSGENRE